MHTLLLVSNFNMLSWYYSYERNYKLLVDSMIKKDLALKGNLDDVELLIFPSNQLPENSQRKFNHKIYLQALSDRYFVFTP